MSEVVNAAGAAPAGGEQPAPESQVAPTVNEPAVTPEPLADLLAQHRREKAERTRARTEADGYKSRVTELEAKLAQLENARKDILGDPVGYLRAHGVTDEELPLIGEATMYERMPGKAPPDLRARMLEAKLERERRTRETEAAERARAAEAEQAENQIRTYHGVLSQAVQAGAGDFPVSSEWFAESPEDHVESLMHTARNMAQAAEQRGEVADLSPASVRRTLEEFLAKRVQRATRSGGAGTPAAVGEKTNESPRGVSGQSAAQKAAGPRPDASTDEERRRRAKEVLETFDKMGG